jgi:mono/diheme cytochrome c family protein
MKLPKAAWYLITVVALAALWAWKTGYLWPEPSLDPNPLAITRGEAVMKARCWSCHETIALPPRVAGWTPEYAYDALGHLPELRPAMPPFRGTDQERADLAIYLASVGATARPLAAEEGEAEWQPPSFEPPREAPEPAASPSPAPRPDAR